MQILSNIEAAQRNNRLFATLKEGNTALQQLQKQVALEDVERLNDETTEARDYQEQLRDLLGQSLSAQDDAEALEELEKIQVLIICLSAGQLVSLQLDDRSKPTAGLVDVSLSDVSQIKDPHILTAKTNEILHKTHLLFKAGEMEALVAKPEASFDCLDLTYLQAAQEEAEMARLPQVPAHEVSQGQEEDLPEVPGVRKGSLITFPSSLELAKFIMLEHVDDGSSS